MAASTKKPNEELDKFLLRMPDGLRERIKSAADLNNRSMNGEIVERLQYSFGGVDEDLDRLHAIVDDLEKRNRDLLESNRKLRRFQEMYEQQGLENARASASWEEWATRQFTDDNTAYILLDAEGVPLSLDEAMVHLREISRAFGNNVERIEANFINTKRVPSDLRVEQLAKLVEFYRSRKSKGE